MLDAKRARAVEARVTGKSLLVRPVSLFCCARGTVPT